MNTYHNLISSLGLAIGMSLGVSAHADALLGGDLTADNAFFAYVSTDDSVRGALVASGNSWPTTFTFSNFNLSAGQNYYLHVEAIDYGQPNGFIGTFTLSNNQFHFENGLQALSTDTTNWAASAETTFNQTVAEQPWVAPTGSPVSFGFNGVGPWGQQSVDASAQWIWSSTYNGTAFLSTEIISAVPLPSPLPLFTVGLLSLGVLRRKSIQA